MTLLRSVILSGIDFVLREWEWKISVRDWLVTVFWGVYRAAKAFWAYWWYPVPKAQYEARREKCLACPVFYEPNGSCGHSSMPRNLMGCGCSLKLKWHDPAAECWLYLFTDNALYKWPTGQKDKLSHSERI